VIGVSAGISIDDLATSPFAEHGGADGALLVLGDKTGEYLQQLNDELTA